MNKIYAVVDRNYEGVDILYLTTDKQKAEYIQSRCREHYEIDEYIDGDISIIDEHIFSCKMEPDGLIVAEELCAEVKLEFDEPFEEIKEHRGVYGFWLSMFIKAETKDDAELKAYNMFKDYIENLPPLDKPN